MQYVASENIKTKTVAVERMPGKITLLDGTRNTDETSFYISSKVVSRSVVHSGCMRGNDTFTSNGSASVGDTCECATAALHRMSYNEFMNFNYGQ